jgi:hypothetical protein
MMAYGVRFVTLGLVILLAFISAGCGLLSGGGGDPPPIDTTEVLRQQGLLVDLKTDKSVYSRGEPVHFQLSITNAGTRERDLDLHRKWDSNEEHTCDYGFLHNVNSYPSVWSSYSQEQITKQVAPGEKIVLVDIVWDQKCDDGSSAEAGLYDVAVSISNLYVDGRKLCSLDNFQVGASKRLQIQ